MRVQLVAPPPADLTNGNRVTALRWAGILRELGHRARVRHGELDGPADVLVALHAIKSFAAAQQFRARFPDRALVVALTGTDMYGADPIEPALALADRIVVLQERALAAVPRRFRERARVIYQSAVAPAVPAPKPARRFRVAVVGNLRPVKDPLRAALAARGLPAESRIEVVHAGRALSDPWGRRALAEAGRNARYRWVGELPPARARRLIASSHVVAITSRSEGSSNVLSEALACGVPVIATRIPGLAGTLGRAYPGYVPVGDTAALRRMLSRAEREPAFYRQLLAAGRAIATRVHPARERAAWRSLLRELS
jgi:putative glycosyltransferase (TIGR04348 family)